MNKEKIRKRGKKKKEDNDFFKFPNQRERERLLINNDNKSIHKKQNKIKRKKVLALPTKHCKTYD